MPVFAQSTPSPDIVVTGTRIRDVFPERSLTQDAISGYGVSTVEDLIDEIRSELGDDDEDPIFLVNGERVENLDDVAGFPVEALERLEVLPRGSGTRVGGSATRRVYSLNLKRKVRTATVTVAPRIATDGDWGGVRGEVILTRIKGQNRVNLSLRAREEDRLLENERGIIQPEQRLPFGLRGNVIAASLNLSDEIDPVLSALAGRPVTVAAVPAGTAPVLSDFMSRAEADQIDLGQFRTLQPRTRGYDLNFSHGTKLAPWLTSSTSARLSFSERTSLSGLPSGVFILAPGSPFSPFSQPVAIARFGNPEALEQKYSTLRGSVTANLNAAYVSWRFNLSGTYEESSSRSLIERQASGSFSPVFLESGRNPFLDDLTDLLPLTVDRSISLPNRSNVRLTATGSPIKLPAGPAQLTSELRYARNSLISRSTFSGEERSQSFSRSERAVRGALDLPLASRRNGFLPALGELSTNLDYALIDLSDGTARELTYGFVWSPLEWIRFNGSRSETRTPPSLEVLGNPLTINPDVRLFDPLRGGTVDVTLITGGNSFLLPERLRTHRLAVNLRPLQSIGLQINGEYTTTAMINSVSSIPLENASIVLAFPERFFRDESGSLTIVDVRPVNFSRQSQERVRYGFSFNLPIGQARPAGGRSAPAPSTDAGPGDSEGTSEAPSLPTGPRPRLQVSANHSWVFENEVVVRPGVDPIGLLRGAAIGFSGARPRHQLDGTLGYSFRGLGARLTATWRSESLLEVQSNGINDTLRFSPLATVNLRAFSEASRLFPKVGWLKATRFTLAVTNLTNQRQRVEDALGNTPLRYQPGYRDALGRSVEIEIRRVF